MNLYYVQDSETWKRAPKAARSEFIEAMRECQCSAQATRDAWEWFIIGYCAAEGKAP
jgi:hypothetical protein